MKIVLILKRKKTVGNIKLKSEVLDVQLVGFA